MRVIRTFHPVGQGAFYTERFESANNRFTIVYDCGSTTLSKKQLDNKIKTSFPKDHQIDILFISHFHADHINGIETLKKHCKIKTVVLPELTHSAKILLKIVYYIENSFEKLSFEKFEQLIEAPLSFFDEEHTQIVMIEPVKEGLQSHDVLSPETIDTSSPREIKTLPCGSAFSYPQAPSWLFIPFNHKQEERRKQFEEAIASKGILLTTLNDISEITKQEKRLREVYDTIDGDLNENSMILYSGPEECSIFKIPFLVSRSLSFFRGYQDNWPTFQAGCLYTGDINWTAGDFLNELSKFSRCLGTIQIPHHGSRHNFNKSLLELQYQGCAIFSFGSNNSYGHPADSVVEEVVKEGILPCLVTEDPSSIVIQDIS